MEIPNYPPNKKLDQSRRTQDKNIKRVTSDGPIRRKKSLGHRFRENFVAGDAKSAVDFVIFDVMMPAVKDAAVEVTSQFFEKLIFGDSRRRRSGSTTPQSGPTGVVSYNRYYMGTPQTSPQRVMSRRARATHDFDDIVLPVRGEAENVIDQMYEVVSQYGRVTVADLYAMVGVTSTYVDEGWGWVDLRGSGVTRTRDGYLLDLPQPISLD